MAQAVLEFSEDQMQFLAVLHAMEGPVPIEVAGILAPLLPGPLFELIEKGQTAGWLQKGKDNYFSITNDLPDSMEEALARMNSPKKLNSIVKRVYAEQLAEKIGPREMLNLLDRADRNREAGECEIHLAHEAFRNNDRETTRKYLRQAVERFFKICPDKNADKLFISSVLELSNISFSLGYGFAEIEKYLVKARDVAKNQGDQRSHALLNLHLGRLFYFSNRRDAALTSLTTGFEKINKLGDDDIFGRSAVFLGLFYFLKGQHKEAIEHFEKAEQAFETAKLGMLTHPIMPFFTGYCACYLGQFHKAIGNLDYHWRLAQERSDMSLASTIRAVLGTVLVYMGKVKEGVNHLQNALEQAEKHGNVLGAYFARGGIQLHHYLEGRLEKSYQICSVDSDEAIQAGIIYQFASPWVLEARYEFHRLGFELPNIDFPDLIDQALKGVNVHLKGVALRLMAKEKIIRGEKEKAIEKDLAESMNCLEQSGDPVQLSKTILEMARIKLKTGDREEARHLVSRARYVLGGYVEEFFPDKFRYLIEKEEGQGDSDYYQSEYLRRYLEMIESLYPIESQQEILTRVLIQTSRMFGAERSALFWFPSPGRIDKYEVRATSNLSSTEISSDTFKTSLEKVIHAFKTNQPQVGRLSEGEALSEYPMVRSVLCIPIEVSGSVREIMYYDNSYLQDAFNFLDPETIRDIARHTSLVVERRFNHLKITQERDVLASMKTLSHELDKHEIITNSSKMTRLLEQVDHVAETESTVLILGETGTGKELLANRIHNKSHRSEEPFIVVDSSTIPDALLESELFGHERGAFTGADRRKIGRIEMANKGTLFLDEIGELPLSAQVKLLRAIQEKEFKRVGGAQIIRSNFRLIAATNKKLDKEVAEGRFRADLYYRLNVIPMQLPPLRDRVEDIPVLANYFLGQYIRDHKQKELKLTAAQKNALCRYKWPGNIRELKNVIERTVLLSDDTQLELNLPSDIQTHSDNPFADFPTLEDVQRRYIDFVIQKTGGQIGGPGGTAEILGMNRTSVYSRMRQLKINVESLRKNSDNVESC